MLAATCPMQGGFEAAAILYIIFWAFVIIFAIMLLPRIFFLLTVQKTLSRCAIQNRAMEPGLVWLSLIPFFSLIWNFIIVINVSKSLTAEFAARQIPVERDPGQALGLAWCILKACAVIPFLGIFPGFAGLICWIIYWVKIAGFNTKLAISSAPQSI
ncbi:MAG: hypothetical protein A2178_01805 [Planctomycetes bacterium GWC2_49_10]|nr:MAG: hypothetical protein A2178_01805 [Planctomycetes bacterium GWC2_49_10]